ncbi:cyclase family protein [Sphaerochaeta sp.]|uniref:cyclase family protein n=1 Tax=Sphaerochaeta sp. TaxID=1972642 RepID=UPI003D128B54
MNALAVAGLRFDQLGSEHFASFSFSEEQLLDACVQVKKRTQSNAVVIVCTCDRVEVWYEQAKTDVAEPFLRSLSLSILAWKPHVYLKHGQEALEHLFLLGCGLLSPLFGEDQIISQLMASIDRSRLAGCASPLLEYLFREAVTTAKRVQASVDLQVPDKTVADFVEAQLASLVQKRILVIGSSSLARLVSSHLATKGYEVTMTFRDMEKADLLLPDHVRAIAYEQRFSSLETVAAVVSATKGMEYTLTYEQVKGPLLLIDLAGVPDIDPSLAGKEGITLVRLDYESFPLPRREEAKAVALSLIGTDVAKVNAYLAYRKDVPLIQDRAEQAALDLLYRLHHQLKEHEASDALRQIIYESARKAFSHQLYEQKKSEAAVRRFDLTRVLTDGQQGYAGDPPVRLSAFHTLEQEGWNLTQLSFGSHSSTHMDSPHHMLEGNRSLDTYPPDRFFATAYVLDCTTLDRLGIQDLPSSELGYDAIIFYTEYGKRACTLTQEVVTHLLEMGVRLFGFDIPNPDGEGDLSFPLHHQILSADGLIIENLANLGPIVGKRVELVCLPLLYKDADGSPVRVVATLRS